MALNSGKFYNLFIHLYSLGLNVNCVSTFRLNWCQDKVMSPQELPSVLADEIQADQQSSNQLPVEVDKKVINRQWRLFARLSFLNTANLKDIKSLERNEVKPRTRYTSLSDYRTVSPKPSVKKST
uniref:Uncharacterized protein n=1 Tax=Physcomitrium patens TaxID=3218 RepID=A0A2K1KKJ0_PHYPA|nr:hypothetical protein PHYPA_007962 [Physcomitrium patens]